MIPTWALSVTTIALSTNIPIAIIKAANEVRFKPTPQINMINKVPPTENNNELPTNTPALIENKEVIKETIDTARSLTSINITMQLLSWDVFWGSILAIPTALMVMKKAKPENDGMSQS